MFDRIAVLTIALAASVSVSLPVVAQDLGRLDQRIVGMPGNDGPEARPNSTISGAVRTQDDRPLADARVEVRDLASGAVLASGYTSPSGTFEVVVPDGNFEIVATSGLSESRERVRVDGAGGSVTLRMPHLQAGSPPGDGTVSVAAMRVPDKAKREFEKASDALKKNQVEESRKHLAKALEIYPQYSDALTMRGVTAMAANDLKAAADDLQAAIQSDANNSYAYVAMGALYNRTHHFDDALRTLDRGVALNPTSWQAFFEMSRAELGKGDFEGALRKATKAEELVGKVYDPLYLVKAHAMLGMKNYQAAITEFEKYLSSEKDDPESASEVRQQVEQIRSFMASAK